MHAVRDSRCDGRRLRGVSRARLLLRKEETQRASPRRGAETEGARTAGQEWWQTYFDSQYLLEYEPIFSPERDRHEVARVIELIGLPLESRVLDVPCGQGRHAHLLAEAGYRVAGLDYSEHLLRVARKRGTAPSLRYTRGDMRKLPLRWSGRFDAVLNLFTSFGFFSDPQDDVRVIGEFARVLRPGGILLWHGGSRDGVMSRFLSRDWWNTSDGTMIAHERSFDPLSGVLSIVSSWSAAGKRGGHRTHRIRLYTATRLAELCADAGLIVEQGWSGFDDRPLSRISGEMMLLARKS